MGDIFGSINQLVGAFGSLFGTMNKLDALDDQLEFLEAQDEKDSKMWEMLMGLEDKKYDLELSKAEAKMQLDMISDMGRNDYFKGEPYERPPAQN